MPSEQVTQPAWRHSPHGGLGSAALAVLAEGTVRQFERQGVPLGPKNRARQALEVIQQSNEGRLKITKDDPKTLALIAEAIRDTRELHLIARTIPRGRDADLDGKLKVMLHGSRRRSSKPRDFQFEQLVGALFAMGSIPTWSAEPDLRFTLHNEDWGVAVKRVRAPGQLGARTTRARQQLENQQLRGVIALNVDAFLEGVPAEGVAGEVGARFSSAIERLHRLLPDLAEQRSLLGVLIIGAVAGWTFEGEMPRLAHPLIFQGRSFVDDPADRAVTDELFNRLERGMEERIAEVYAEIKAVMPRERGTGLPT